MFIFFPGNCSSIFQTESSQLKRIFFVKIFFGNTMRCLLISCQFNRTQTLKRCHMDLVANQVVRQSNEMFIFFPGNCSSIFQTESSMPEQIPGFVTQVLEIIANDRTRRRASGRNNGSTKWFLIYFGHYFGFRCCCWRTEWFLKILGYRIVLRHEFHN